MFTDTRRRLFRMLGLAPVAAIAAAKPLQREPHGMAGTAKPLEAVELKIAIDSSAAEEALKRLSEAMLQLQLQAESATQAFERLAKAGGVPGHVNVEVHAMDAKSFLDHSDEIAAAVRKAMAGGHPLNFHIS